MPQAPQVGTAASPRGQAGARRGSEDL